MDKKWRIITGIMWVAIVTILSVSVVIYTGRQEPQRVYIVCEVPAEIVVRPGMPVQINQCFRTVEY